MAVAYGGEYYSMMLGNTTTQFDSDAFYYLEGNTVAFPDVAGFHEYFWWDLTPGTQVMFLPQMGGKLVTTDSQGRFLVDGTIGTFAGCENDDGNIALYYYGGGCIDSTKCSAVELSLYNNSTFAPWS
ncbi:hypothetical protein CANARDRAFT_26059 [[Candida] arabinofermentans NRRL YB-2248]|uniref:Uncharacterized protein n=1 Tax=[Candida] arabinofermentans NRRL YB-2248 TaxID=983967 RepID=A0A1E4T7Z3_9ASCO|nr:hypothetical protein CANARDRAFT_26059 [[Candida] arabinofermentans NRRL YB-2248]